MEERQERYGPSYRFHEYHQLKVTLEEIFMQTGDKAVFQRPIFQKRVQRRETKVNIAGIIGL